MKKYVHVNNSNGQIFTEDTVVDTWADGSPRTIKELVEIKGEKDYILVNEDLKQARVAEVFDLAVRIMVAHASAGIKPEPETAFEISLKAYKLKDQL